MGSLVSRFLARLFGSNKDVRVLMVGLDAGGKTTILYKLKLGDVVTTIPTLGFNATDCTKGLTGLSIRCYNHNQTQQEGLTQDLLPFRTIMSPSVWTNIVQDLGDTGRDAAAVAAFQSVNSLLKSWLPLYGPRRLMHLCRHLPVFAALVPVAASFGGNLDLLRLCHRHPHLHEEMIRPLDEATPELCYDVAAGQGHHAIVTFLEQMYGPHNTSASRRAMDWAAQYGHLDMVQRLHSTRAEGCTTQAMNLASSNGHLQVVRFLHEHRREGCSTFAMNSAAEFGHVEVVQFLMRYRREGCSRKAIDMAARNGHLEVVQLLHNHRTDGCTTQAMDGAARNGHLDVVQFLHQYRTEGCTSWAVDLAAQNGHLEVVQFLLMQRTETCTTWAMDEAATNGHLDIVEYLHGCMKNHNLHHHTTCTKEAMDGASANGHLGVVKFLHTHRTEGCTSLALHEATSKGHHHVAAYLCQHREALGLLEDSDDIANTSQ
ncbi:hypothetical protein DYB38_002395 [Aphanomyces astaci]|uniref:Uncharacterized protein n=1 Tax=Aphanomyces astaci TaxID=112090 RepID=A0A397D930_APHAT|nr:hypothetical protein DYB38_002395 [Aphanomyces astaci]